MTSFQDEDLELTIEGGLVVDAATREDAVHQLSPYNDISTDSVTFYGDEDNKMSLSKKLKWLFLAFVVLAVILAAVLGVTMSGGAGEDKASVDRSGTASLPPEESEIASLPPKESEPTLIELLIQPLLPVGNEFDDPNSYQSKSLSYLEDTLSPQTDEEYKVYFALASIYYASFGVQNKRTIKSFPTGETLRGWITSDHWVTDSNYCIWYGIVCDTNGAVTEIQLNENRMFGIFPREISFLKDTLEVIDLFSNPFLVTEGDAGNSWIAEMTNLRHLFFGATSFEYPGVPTFIGQLSKLEEIDFSNSYYSHGPIRAEAFANNTMLNYVALSKNTYTSTIPSTITNHPSIEFLYLQDVTFDGVKQSLDFLVGMPLLQETWNDLTSFDGGLPTGLGSISTLVSISFSFCTLTGTIPTELGNLSSSMDRLWLYQNSLTGTIPTELANLSRLRFLYLEGNKLSGTVPEALCPLKVLDSGLLEVLGTDCGAGQPFDCPCCTCCGPYMCRDFD